MTNGDKLGGDLKSKPRRCKRLPMNIFPLYVRLSQHLHRRDLHIFDLQCYGPCLFEIDLGPNYSLFNKKPTTSPGIKRILEAVPWILFTDKSGCTFVITVITLVKHKTLCVIWNNRARSKMNAKKIQFTFVGSSLSLYFTFNCRHSRTFKGT